MNKNSLIEFLEKRINAYFIYSFILIVIDGNAIVVGKNLKLDKFCHDAQTYYMLSWFLYVGIYNICFNFLTCILLGIVALLLECKRKKLGYYLFVIIKWAVIGLQVPVIGWTAYGLFHLEYYIQICDLKEKILWFAAVYWVRLLFNIGFQFYFFCRNFAKDLK